MLLEAREGTGDRRPTAREVLSRADLYEYLSVSLPGQYTTVVGDAEVRSTATQVKSYLLEAHDDPDYSLVQRLARRFSEVVVLRDKSLIRVEDGKGTTYFVDLLRPRFPVLHTTVEVEVTDQIFKRLTDGSVAGFDHVWMPGQFLYDRRRGQFTGFAFKYETQVAGTRFEGGVDPETGEIREGSRKLRMNVLEDSSAQTEYQGLIDSNNFAGRKALEQIQIRTHDSDEPDQAITNTIYSNGKVIGKGTSLQCHLLTVESVVDAYSSVITRIEDEFSLGWVERGRGHSYHGEPFIFEFPPEMEIVDLVGFAESLFDSTNPFRIFGIIEEISNSRVDVEAIDLHSSDPVSFEITPNWIRVYLPIGSCGNIIARLYSNLQHWVNAEIRLWVGDEDPFTIGQP